MRFAAFFDKSIRYFAIVAAPFVGIILAVYAYVMLFLAPPITPSLIVLVVSASMFAVSWCAYRAGQAITRHSFFMWRIPVYAFTVLMIFLVAINLH